MNAPRVPAPGLAGRIGGLGLLLLLGGSVATGAQRGQQDRLLVEIRQIQSQLAELTEAQAMLTGVMQGVLDARAEDRRNRADSRDAVERMQRDISTITTALAEMNDRFSTLMAEVASVREAQRTAALAAHPIGGGGSDEEVADEDGDSGETAGDGEGGADEVAVLDGPTITETYMQAQSDYLQGRYELAIGGFETVVEGGSELADDARYFIGDALLAQDRLEPALEQFEVVIRDFPDSQRIGDAWFKRGVILRRLGHEADAREIFEDILDVYAGTSAALAAQRELESMGPRDPG